MIEISKLASGLTVVSDNMPSLESAAVGVWVACGARHETPREMGLSHMLEHMAFKGTARRSARDIAEEIEAVGGDLNAYTGRETTAYHARILKEDVPLALDVLSDILIHPAFDETEIARERDVIVQEIGSARDTPDDLVFDYLQEACYPDQPMGWPILGSEKTVTSFTRSDLSRYIGAQYHSEGMILAAAGAVNHAHLVTPTICSPGWQREPSTTLCPRATWAGRSARTMRSSNRRILRSRSQASPPPTRMR